MAFVKTITLENQVPLGFHVISQVDFPSWNRIPSAPGRWVTKGRVVIDRYFNKGAFDAGAPKYDSVHADIDGWLFVSLDLSSNLKLLQGLYPLLQNILPEYANAEISTPASPGPDDTW